MQEAQKEDNKKHSDEKPKKQWVKPDVFIYPVERTMGVSGFGEADGNMTAS
jgi:hypothetical protein